MRNGGYTVQQALTLEAATILKQALTLAKRRGHAQVTPLHVAHTMLSSPTGLFRSACLQSHSHPLQCKALELCFNVALNRLPTSSSNPVFGSHTLTHPSISNALVAAFKRAQAHQRRGSLESQQQPLLAVKIELEQLIISILDDPSVSRVMREARFSSTQVKINVEKAVSLELCSQNTTTQNKNPKEFYPFVSSHSPCSSQELGRLEGKPKELNQKREEDVCFIINNMLQNRRNIVIVGECVDTLEGLVKDLMGKVDKGDVHENFKEAKFITLPILHLNLSREEVEQKIVELKSMVTRYMEKGVVLYLGDLKWISEYRASSSYDQGRGLGQYCQVDSLVMEIGKLGCNIEENNRFWIMGIACFKTYMKCKSGSPSLESILRLHPITIPDGNLSLCLNHESDIEIGLADEQLKSYSETGTSIFRRSISSSQLTTSSLPLWLQKYKDENNIHQGCVPRSDLCETPISNTSVSPSCSTKSFSYDHQNLNYEPRFKSSTTSCSKGLEQALPPYQSSPSNSSSSSCLMEVKYIENFKELNYENFKILCTSLEQQVPFQRDIIPEIVTTILQSRSRRKQVNGEIKYKETKETWMCFQGIDVDAKENIARELARLIFGSSTNFVSVTSSSFSCSKYHTNGELRNKRSRDDQYCGSYLKVFSEAVLCDPHRVFFLDNIEHVDHYSQLGIKKAIESGSVRDSNGKEVSLQDAIIILSCKNFDSNSRTNSPHIKPKIDNVEKEKAVSLDLNISFEDTESEDEPFDDIGLLKCVEGRIIFKAHAD